MGGHGGGQRRAGGGEVLLLWGRDARGVKVRADRLAPADRRARGPFTCLGCGEPLTPHLGKVRAHHFAHLPGSRCPLTAPETALHLDAKERLLALCRDAFGRTRRVTLLTRCPSCRRQDPRDLAALGDAAEDEGAVGPLRADVLVRAGAAPAVALEVKVTHAVEPEKEAALAAAAVPFVEIDAREGWELEGAEGAAEIVCARSAGFPPCPACVALARAEDDRARGGEAAEIAELEVYRARGLFGPLRPGAARAGGPFSDRERAELAGGFRCPECGGSELLLGERLARHPCARAGLRPVAWRTPGGQTVHLGWWRKQRNPLP